MQTPRIILLYDDNCRWCTRLAKTAFRLSRSHIRLAGHYSNFGHKVKKLYFRTSDHPEDMFWLIRDDTAYGGRKGILPLATEILRGILV